MSEEKAPNEGTKVVLQSNMPEEALVVPEGEAGIVSEMKEEGDPLAITHGEKPVFDVELAAWTQDGEPLSVEESKQKVRLVLAKDKKFYQRGLMQLIINGRAPVVLHIDTFMSCIFNVYETKNPYETYDPNKPIIKAFGMVKEEHVEETTDTPEHTKKTLLDITMDETDLLRLKEKHPEGKPIDMLLAIEESDPHKEEIK